MPPGLVFIFGKDIQVAEILYVLYTCLKNKEKSEMQNFLNLNHVYALLNINLPALTGHARRQGTRTPNDEYLAYKLPNLKFFSPVKFLHRSFTIFVLTLRIIFVVIAPMIINEPRYSYFLPSAKALTPNFATSSEDAIKFSFAILVCSLQRYAENRF
jgi:hypothetical protein